MEGSEVIVDAVKYPKLLTQGHITALKTFRLQQSSVLVEKYTQIYTTRFKPHSEKEPSGWISTSLFKARLLSVCLPCRGLQHTGGKGLTVRTGYLPHSSSCCSRRSKVNSSSLWVRWDTMADNLFFSAGLGSPTGRIKLN